MSDMLAPSQPTQTSPKLEPSDSKSYSSLDPDQSVFMKSESSNSSQTDHLDHNADPRFLENCILSKAIAQATIFNLSSLVHSLYTNGESYAIEATARAYSHDQENGCWHTARESDEANASIESLVMGSEARESLTHSAEISVLNQTCDQIQVFPRVDNLKAN
ncbi:hypothetical protein Ciccas_010796 [Cichlidogyrus casuarinus]|uniref:Uncharacterized protein n=1 Tax=Cichlidogyrus casuarinus TaxID=1844966 RepID=A0ABD2PT34_9PLAT